MKTIGSIVRNVVAAFFNRLSIFFPKDGTIIFGGVNRQVFRDNSRYLVEYFASQGMDKIYYVTDNAEIEEYLSKRGVGTIGSKQILKYIWVALKTSKVVDSGTSFYDPLRILDTKKTVKITTMHGSGPKQVISRFHPPDNDEIALQQITNLYKFDYLNYPSKYACLRVGKKIHLLPNKKIVSLGYPRCDQFFDKKFVAQQQKSKVVARSINKNINNESKLIFYTPTWRPYLFNFPLFYMPDIDLRKFNDWLRKNNYYFFFSIHSANIPNNIPISSSNISLVDSDLPFFDTNSLMLEVDVLINDYSTTSTDFALLSRPQVFFMPDFVNYEEECGFVEDYESMLVGNVVSSQKELISELIRIFSNYDRACEEFRGERSTLLQKYYDVGCGNACENFHKFILSL